MSKHPDQSIRPENTKPTALRLGLVLSMAMPLMVNAAGTVTVNGQRTFNIDAETTFSLDGAPISASQAAQAGAGYSAQVTIENVNSTTTGGNAANVDLRNLVLGPVTSTEPLSVLSQPLVVTAETVLVDIPESDLANIVPGDLLKVSGFLDSNGAIAATRIQMLTNTTIDWKLFGAVSALNGSAFAIGAQAVNFTGATPVGCEPALQNGQFVEIEALPNPGFSAGAVLNQLTQLECEDPNFIDPPPGTIAASLEGIISGLPDPLPSPVSFSMLGIEVLTNAQTGYRAGTIDDLDIGVRIEVEGFYDNIAQTITAHEIRFVQAQVRFEAPVAPTDVTPGQSIAIMGSTAEFTAQTRDEDGIVAGIAASMQVELRGLIDGQGQIFATRVRERGQPDFTDTELRGPVATINPPELLVLGITVDTSAAQFRDHTNAVISETEFFARVFSGTLVSAEGGVFDPLTATMAADVVQLEENTVPPATAATNGQAARGVARGTLTQVGGDSIFGSGFD